MEIDREAWSGDGELTAALLEALEAMEEVAVVRVQDAPASRAEAGYAFICNDVFVGFRRRRALVVRRVLRFLPVPALVHAPSLTLGALQERLAESARVGSADYGDEQMIQYLRAERVRGAYQARSQKIVEVVRVFEAHPAAEAR